MRSDTQHKLERLWWGGWHCYGINSKSWVLWGRVGGCSVSLEVLQVRPRHGVRASGSTTVCVRWGFTTQRCRQLDFTDPAAHGIARCFFNKDVCFRESHLSNVSRFRLRGTQRPELSKRHSRDPNYLNHTQPVTHLSQRDQTKTDSKENNLFSASLYNRSCPPALLSKPAAFSSC